jgi:hypothetical protein
VKNIFRLFVIVSFATCLVYSCKPTEIDLASADTFSVIQSEILNKSCATSGCHQSEKDPSFIQHGLILTSDVAYENLVNKSPENITAQEHHLKRVIPYDFENSLLYQKLLFESSHESELNFGSIMPLGNDMLFKGQVEFIRKWIEAGAPKTGIVADVALLDDRTPSVGTFEPLSPPAAGQGFQMKLDPFEIFPYFEREIFVRKPLQNTETVYVNKFQIKMHPGSHHFILYGFRNTATLPTANAVRDLRNKDNSLNISTFTEMSNHIFYFGGSESNFTFNFPAGTAVELPANMQFDMNSHYFNKGAKPYNGEVNINLYTVPKSEVKNPLKVLDLGNTTFELPPNKTTVATKSFTFNSNVKIVTLFSHTHKLGQKFEILIKGGSRDGEIIYTSKNWEHPTKTDYATPISLKKGEGLTSRITYNNTSDKVVRFGFTSDDEMGIIFGYYFEE